MVRTFYSHQFPDGCVSIFPSVVVAATVTVINSTRTPFIRFFSSSSLYMAFIIFIFYQNFVRRPVNWILYQHCFQKKWITSSCILYSAVLFFVDFFSQYFKLTQSVILFDKYKSSRKNCSKKNGYNVKSVFCCFNYCCYYHYWIHIVCLLKLKKKNLEF